VKNLFFLPLLLFITSCYSLNTTDPGKIAKINILDRNGMSETINSKDRLSFYENTDFLSPQPYQKVMRVYGRQKNGDVYAQITSYHPNGQVKQYLEALNNRAFGNFQEWYPNGLLKVQACIIGGIFDLNNLAEESWVFDHTSRAWDEEGRLIAEINYKKGELEGESRYYHSNGTLWKLSPFSKNLLHGTQYIYEENGTLFQTTDFAHGIKQGTAIRFWGEGRIAYQEIYKQGHLLEGYYFSPQGVLTSSIENGKGDRALFGKSKLLELQAYREGVQAGAVRVFDESEKIIQTYGYKNGEKHGEEIYYFPGTSQPKLLLTWQEGELQGPAKTWYENGSLESQREISQNKKNGLLTAWYQNGALMLAEEYDDDRLVKGEYYRMGERAFISKVEKGNGVASLFNSEGNFSRKVYYEDGKPLE